jgi:ethanolamine utilization protein EutP
MKKTVILIGSSGAGKTTLAQTLGGRNLAVRKTQTIDIMPGIIDTPGEYLERKQMIYHLLTSSYDADLVVMCEAADSGVMSFPPGFAALFTIPSIGIVTKIDLTRHIETAEFRLRYAGAEQIFPVSSVTGEGLDALRAYLSCESGGKE